MSEEFVGEQYHSPQAIPEFHPDDTAFFNQLGERAQLDMVDAVEVYESPDARAAQIILKAEPEIVEAAAREQTARSIVDRFELKQQALSHFTPEDAAFLNSDPAKTPESSPTQNWWIHAGDDQNKPEL